MVISWPRYCGAGRDIVLSRQIAALFICQRGVSRKKTFQAKQNNRNRNPE